MSFPIYWVMNKSTSHIWRGSNVLTFSLVNFKTVWKTFNLKFSCGDANLPGPRWRVTWKNVKFPFFSRISTISLPFIRSPVLSWKKTNTDEENQIHSRIKSRNKNKTDNKMSQQNDWHKNNRKVITSIKHPTDMCKWSYPLVRWDRIKVDLTSTMKQYKKKTETSHVMGKVVTPKNSLDIMKHRSVRRRGNKTTSQFKKYNHLVT